MNVKEFAFLWDIDGVVADSPHEGAWREVAQLPEWSIEGLTSDFYLNHVASKPREEGAGNILEMLGGYKKLGADSEDKKKELLDKYCDQKNKIIVDFLLCAVLLRLCKHIIKPIEEKMRVRMY